MFILSELIQGNSEAKKRYWESVSEFVVLESDHLTLLNVYNQFVENSMSKPWCDSMNLSFKVMHDIISLVENSSC